MPIKIAVVGTGKVARESYLPYLAQQQDVALTYFSRTPAKAAACAGDFGGSVANSVPELLAAEPDAVLVLTGEMERQAVTLELLAGRPKRLFFEKPLVAQNGQANVVEEDFFAARDLLQRARAAGTETAMVFNYRFFEQSQRIRQIVRDRDFGRLRQASLFVNYACWSHSIDLLHLFGGRAARISALAGDTPYAGAVDVAGSFVLENGATGTILGTSGTKFAHPCTITPSTSSAAASTTAISTGPWTSSTTPPATGSRTRSSATTRVGTSTTPPSTSHWPPTWIQSATASPRPCRDLPALRNSNSKLPCAAPSPKAGQ